VAAGTFAQVARNKRSVTAAFLTGREQIEIPKERRKVTSPPPGEKPKKAGRRRKV
jgi:excinuclease UvrABC ATPase subunit